jgi:hypothetical protein
MSDLRNMLVISFANAASYAVGVMCAAVNLLPSFN